MKFTERKFLFVFLIIFMIIGMNFSFQLEDLNKPVMFEDEICSYNGQPDTTKNYPDNISCICQEEYTNDPSLNRTINGMPVQCSYERRRRFITLFLSIFIPFGVDYLYLGRFYIFLIVFGLCWLAMIGNCYRFAVSPQEDYFKSTYNLLFLILAFLLLTWWVVNVALIWTGVIKDAQGIDTVNDLDFLINLNTKS